MSLTINGHNRSRTAGTQTSHRLQGEHAVIRGFLLAGRVQIVPDSFVDWAGFANMASSTCADFNDVFSLSFQREVFIESGYTVYLGCTDPQLLCQDTLPGQALAAGLLSLSHSCSLLFKYCSSGIYAK